MPIEPQNKCNEKLFDKAKKKAAKAANYFTFRAGSDNINNGASLPAEVVCGIASSYGIRMDDESLHARDVRTSSSTIGEV